MQQNITTGQTYQWKSCLTHELASTACKKWSMLWQPQHAGLSASRRCCWCTLLPKVWLSLRVFVALRLTLVSFLRSSGGLISHPPLPRLVSTAISRTAFVTRLLALYCNNIMYHSISTADSEYILLTIFAKHHWGHFSKTFKGIIV